MSMSSKIAKFQRESRFAESLENIVTKEQMINAVNRDTVKKRAFKRMFSDSLRLDAHSMKEVCFGGRDSKLRCFVKDENTVKLALTKCLQDDLLSIENVKSMMRGDDVTNTEFHRLQQTPLILRPTTKDYRTGYDIPSAGSQNQPLVGSSNLTRGRWAVSKPPTPLYGGANPARAL